MLGKRNLSTEILTFYLQGLYHLRGKNIAASQARASLDEELVGLPRALESFKELFEKLIPNEIFPTLRKKIEELATREETSNNMSI